MRLSEMPLFYIWIMLDDLEGMDVPHMSFLNLRRFERIAKRCDPFKGSERLAKA